MPNCGMLRSVIMKYETSMNEVFSSMGWNSWPSSKSSRFNSLKVVKNLVQVGHENYIQRTCLQLDPYLFCNATCFLIFWLYQKKLNCNFFFHQATSALLAKTLVPNWLFFNKEKRSPTTLGLKSFILLCYANQA